MGDALAQSGRRAACWAADAVARLRDEDRGDVPGWVMVTMMTAALVVLVLGIATDSLQRILEEALATVHP